MDINSQFFRFFKPYLAKAANTIQTGKVMIFVGINAIGKSILVEQILSGKFRKEFLKNQKVRLVFLSFKDRSGLSKEQLYDYWLTQTQKACQLKKKPEEINDFSFDSYLSEIVKGLGPDEKISFILQDAQNIFNQDNSFFQSLIYLSIYSYGKVSYILLSEPQILNVKNTGLQKFIQRFTKYKFTFLPLYDAKTSLADIKRQELLLGVSFDRYREMIIKYSRGLHGAIRSFCFLLKDHPDAVNIRRLMKIAYNDKLCRFWVKEVLNSLPFESLRIFKEVSLNRTKFQKYKNSLEGRWLADLGLVKGNGELRFPLLLPILSEFSLKSEKEKEIKRVKNNFIIYGEKVNFSKKELAVFNSLYKKKGRVVSFDCLGDALWQNEPDKFSLWAIAQTVRRLKRKLSTYFINPQIIRSVSGEGYILI